MLLGGRRSAVRLSTACGDDAGVARGRKQNLIRLSVARAKVRSGYSSRLAVCCSGFLAGIVLFAVWAGLYLSVELLRSGLMSPYKLPESVRAISEAFGIAFSDGESSRGWVMSLAVLSAALGLQGMAAGMILRYRIRKEPSKAFFKKRLRIPWDILPFVVFFAYAGLARGKFPAVYLAASLIVGYLWRFWNRTILSGMSSLDVDRLIPKPV
jgi:hypothetical protein